MTVCKYHKRLKRKITGITDITIGGNKRTVTSKHGKKKKNRKEQSPILK